MNTPLPANDRLNLLSFAVYIILLAAFSFIPVKISGLLLAAIITVYLLVSLKMKLSCANAIILWKRRIQQKGAQLTERAYPEKFIHK